jgi:hypothetical protein
VLTISDRRPATEERAGARKTKERLDGLRTPLGAVFLAAYVVTSFAPGSLATVVFLGTGGLLLAMSVPWTSTFHKALALAALLAHGAVILSERFDAGAFFEGLPTYFNIVAVLLILSIAGYPIRAARFEVQIRALMAALTRRGAGVRATAGALGHMLGAVLDVGSFVLIDVILRHAAPKERLEALMWAGRAFSFSPLWTNLNVFTATTITLTGVSYSSFLAVTLPFAILGLAVTLSFAQRKKGEMVDSPDTSLNRGAIAVLLYPVLLVAAVALVNVLLPGLPLTAAIAVTVAVAVILIAALATALLRRSLPLRRLGSETSVSNATTMLARLTGLHPLEVGTKRNWGFGLVLALIAMAYLGLLTFLLL